jgi:hypothetical protein
MPAAPTAAADWQGAARAHEDDGLVGRVQGLLGDATQKPALQFLSVSSSMFVITFYDNIPTNQVS